MKSRGGVFLLRLVLGLVVGGSSLALVVTQLHGSRYHLAFLLLGIAELVAAILFLIPRTLRLGGLTLIVIFALAAGFHVLHRQYSVTYLAVYAAAAWAVVSHQRGADERR